MLSYEDIFNRHHTRPLSYLNSYLDSPVTRIPTPVVLRSSALYKERRRPTSIACLDDVSSRINDCYRIAPRDNSLGIFSENNRPVLKDITPRIHSESHRLSDNSSRILNGSPKFPPKYNTSIRLGNGSPKLPRKDITSMRNFTDSPKLAPKYNTSIRIVDDSPKFSPKDITSTRSFTDSPKLTSRESKPKVLRENHGRDTKFSNFSDNYRHAVTFPDRHLSRRELPLCTLDELLDIIREPTGYYALPTDPWNEVYPDIYLGDAPTALCISVLKRIGITHVLNAAQGREKGCGQVNTTPGYYSQSGIHFLGVPAFDNIVFRLYPYFEQSAQFIEDGLNSKGKVLVHCRAGISRSATLVCAFLMLKRGMSVQEAVRSVRKNREIIPNDGFLQQLCDLNDRLKQKKKFLG